MKKIFSGCLLLFLILLGIVAYSPNGYSQGLISSGLKSSSAAIVAAPCLFHGILIITDGTNAATVIVYDNATTNSGTEAFKGTVAGSNNFGGVFNALPINMGNGIYVTVSGTGANYIVYYRAR